MRYLVPLLLVLLLAACDTSEPDLTNYPPPGSNPSIPLSSVATSPPGRYNTQGYVGSYFECPPDTECILPDSFNAVSSLPPESASASVTVLMERPSQLTVEAFYRFSILIEGEPGSMRIIRLLGYEPATP